VPDDTAISAYIPCFNNADTLQQTIDGLINQTHQIAEIFVIDDGSTDESPLIAERAGISVIRHDANLGRGYTRAEAMNTASNEFVLSCDAGKVLKPDFISKALPLFTDNVAAVFGKILQPPARNIVQRWRGRHLFKTEQQQDAFDQSLLVTAGAIVRKRAVISVGNFDPSFRQCEDRELGARLLEVGLRVRFDPSLEIYSIADNDLWQTMERYRRWQMVPGKIMTLPDYLRQINYSIKVMAKRDLNSQDPAAAVISLLSPHYQYWNRYKQS
jgi:glycosyltransferase involved in cell wall biosynthesis